MEGGDDMLQSRAVRQVEISPPITRIRENLNKPFEYGPVSILLILAVVYGVLVVSAIW